MTCALKASLPLLQSIIASYFFKKSAPSRQSTARSQITINVCSQVKDPIETISFISPFTSRGVPLALTADDSVLLITFRSSSDRDVSRTTDTAAPESIRNLVL